uniref:Putative secreted protein n=1 Tax=Xenopsylla cheopis TaxID=163159 RepID=A0A6M2DXJ9_XENCH
MSSISCILLLSILFRHFSASNLSDPVSFPLENRIQCDPFLADSSQHLLICHFLGSSDLLHSPPAPHL